jgi:capsid protein
MNIINEFIEGMTFSSISPEIKRSPFRNDIEPNKNRSPYADWNYSQIMTISFDGEKTPGEIGAVKRYLPDYFILRNRAWQSYIENEVTTTIINKYTTWVIGTGLKLNSEPVKSIIENNEFKPLEKGYVNQVQDRWKLWSKSKLGDYQGVNTLNKLQSIAYKNASIAGDVLVILRTKKNNVTVQLIDADNVCTPPISNGDIGKVEKNTIRDGIEMSPSGEHVAYYVKQSNNDKPYIRVRAKGEKTKRTQAYIVYGDRYRLDNSRGIPIFTSALETLKKLDRYKEAAVGSAEERAKIPYFIEHNSESTGKNPMLDRMAEQLSQNNSSNSDFSSTTKLAETIATTTQKSVFNMEVGSKIVSLAADNELTFKEFYNTIVDSVCSSILMPPEVALSKYGGSFSASRAALKDWEHMLIVARNDFSEQFLQPIYELWLELQISSGEIMNDGYLSAKTGNDKILKLAYTNARWTGANVPHIDPLKEAKAAREKLGPLGAHLPLSNADIETEGLNNGDYTTNVEKFTEEIKIAPKPPVQPTNTEQPKKTSEED